MAKVYTCRKCQSEEIVKNGTNASGSPQYHCKTCGAYGVLEPKNSYTKEAKEIRLFMDSGLIEGNGGP